MSPKKCISIVIPAYREEKNIPLVYEELKSILITISDRYDHEIIFVNDGSPDKTLDSIIKLCAKDIKVKCINLSRNFGKELALFSGVEEASGDIVITMDADGQRPARVILDFLKKWEEGSDIVYGVRTNMRRSFSRKLASNIFNRIMQSISDIHFDTGITDFMLMDRKTIPYILQYKNKNIIFRGIVLDIGFNVEKVFFIEPERNHGTSVFGFKKLFKLAIDSVLSFSIYPLKFVGYFGAFVTLLSTLLLTFMTVSRFFLGDPIGITNTAFFVIANLFISGITLMALGILALYIASIHEEIKQRPTYIVQSKINF